ncbi:MAG: MTH938/NDUFAF3 family protein [Bacteroidota bacterium]|jgi:hypothetical protein
MGIEGTEFGTITIDGVVYEHDVVIRLSGEVLKRKKKLSKREYGTSHIVSKQEIKFILEEGSARIVVGTGQYDSLRLSDGAGKYLAKRKCTVIACPTSEAIRVFNESEPGTIGLFHVTC